MSILGRIFGWDRNRPKQDDDVTTCVHADGCTCNSGPTVPVSYNPYAPPMGYPQYAPSLAVPVDASSSRAVPGYLPQGGN